MACSESDLVELARTDLDAFGELVERYRGSIIRQCRSRVSDAHIAEDLAQETFIRAYLKLDQLREPSFFVGWLRKIASNVCSEFARGPMRVECAWEALPEQHATDAVGLPDSRARLDVLPLAMRECMELYYGDQLSYSEIAEVLGVSQATVRNRLHRAKALLRKGMPELEKRTFTDRVMDRLRALETGDATERARAASELCGGLDDREEGRYRHALDVLRGVVEADMWDIHGAIKVSKKYRSAEMRDALVAVVANGEEEGARIKAAGALVAQKDSTVAPHLKRVLEDSGLDRDVAAAVKSAIAQLQKTELPPPRDFESFRLRRDVQDAANDKRARLELMKKLIAALDDDSAAVRNEAVKALAKLGDKRAAPAVARLLRDPVPGISQAAAITLGDLGGKTAAAALAQALDDELPLPFVEALSRCHEPGTIPAVLRALSRSTGDIRDLHGWMLCLKNIATADYLDAIKEAISGFLPEGGEPPRFITDYWPLTLAQAADRRHLPDLRDALRTIPLDRWREVDELIAAVWRVGGEEAVDILIEHFTNRGTSLAGHGPASLGEDGLEALKEALQNENPDIRYTAYYKMFRGHGISLAGGYLVSLGEAALKPLKVALRSENPEVRAGAYWTIRNGGGADLIRSDPEAAEALRTAAQSEKNNRLKMLAKAALLKLDKPEAWERVAEARRGRRPPSVPPS